MAYLRKTNLKAAEALDYSHPPLTVQLNAGVRQLEIDVYGDSKGGLFAKPAWPGLMAKAGLAPDPPFDPEGLMLKPGFKVLHAQDLDYRSRCQPLLACLAEIRAWSKTHPKHLPIFILIENKDGRSRPEYMVAPEPLTSETFDALDAEIRTVFRPGEMITPDDVRGRHSTLEEAVLQSGWPLLEQSRGKVMFLLDQKRVGPLYTKGHPSLEGRVLFTNATPGHADAAFVEMNDPMPERVKEVVRAGYIVRTMSDPGVAGVRAGDTKRRDAALASGAQMVSTDYPFEEKAAGSAYSVGFEKGNARCNPLLAVPSCREELLSEAAGKGADGLKER
jgi:Phosphoinositide phospholipase C, Ca2+-dependent